MYMHLSMCHREHTSKGYNPWPSAFQDTLQTTPDGFRGIFVLTVESNQFSHSDLRSLANLCSFNIVWLIVQTNCGHPDRLLAQVAPLFLVQR